MSDLNDLCERGNTPQKEDGLAVTFVEAAAGEHSQALLDVDHLQQQTNGSWWPTFCFY
jgi:hypothetical protein